MARLKLRQEFNPRIYCLSMAGSPRRTRMRRRLEQTGLPYEFVYGPDHPPASSIPWSYVKHMEGVRMDPLLRSSYVNGVAGCKAGTAMALQKGVDDGAPWFIFCNDDVHFDADFASKVRLESSLVPETAGMLNLCHLPNTRQTEGAVCAGRWWRVGSRCRLEWCFLIKRWFAKRYIQCLEEEGAESDVCCERMRNKTNAEILILKAPIAFLSKEGMVASCIIQPSRPIIL